MKIFNYTFIGIAAILIADFTAENFTFADEKPVPGKQVAQEIELPASTSNWGIGVNKDIGLPRPVDTTKTEIVRYYLFLPADYEEKATKNGSPLFLFLHGAGERGDTPADVQLLKKHGPPKLLDEPEFAKSWSCITVTPQCKKNYGWSPQQLMLLLDSIEKQFKVDKERVYVSGISMGGFGTWMCLNEAPQRFAAAAPICGGAKTEWAAKFKDIPIWNFHGNKDPGVNIALSKNIVEAIRAEGGKKIIFTIYAGAGHDVWTRTYENQLLYDWLFSFPR
jgi:predicted peptidase